MHTVFLCHEERKHLAVKLTDAMSFSGFAFFVCFIDPSASSPLAMQIYKERKHLAFTLADAKSVVARLEALLAVAAHAAAALAYLLIFRVRYATHSAHQHRAHENLKQATSTLEALLAVAAQRSGAGLLLEAPAMLMF